MFIWIISNILQGLYIIFVLQWLTLIAGKHKGQGIRHNFMTEGGKKYQHLCDVIHKWSQVRGLNILHILRFDSEKIADKMEQTF